MPRRWLSWSGLSALSLASAWLLAALPALAAPATSSLDQISSGTIGTGTLGTVTLTQNGTDEVDVVVTLAADTGFVDTGGPHNAFAFNLNLQTAYSILVSSPTGGIMALGASNSTNTPHGTFVNVIGCTGCGSGGSNPYYGPLDLQITASSGISVANLVANGDGYYFSSDVIGPAGGTGHIASNSITGDPSPVPERASTALLGSGLMGLIISRRRRRI
jgi:hypothetical protein